MLEGVDSEPGPSPGRQQEIDDRLDAIRARRATGVQSLLAEHKWAVPAPVCGEPTDGAA